MIDKLAVLRLDTGFTRTSADDPATGLDYSVYARVPAFWRRLERLMRLDWYLALQAKAIEERYDVIWANSEKVGIPLTLLGTNKPLIVVAHHMESRAKAWLAKRAGIVSRWAAVGYTNPASKRFLTTHFGVPDERLFQGISARYLDSGFEEGTADGNGPILSLGTAKRDYRTLIRALAELPGCQTRIFASSRHGDPLRSRLRLRRSAPAWIDFPGFVSDATLLSEYRRAAFVVLPLIPTNHYSAGMSVMLEAGAMRKAVIATRNEGTASVIVDGETGILVPPRDVAALRSAVQRLWGDPDLAHRMGLQARKLVETEYDPRIVSAGATLMLHRVARRVGNA